MRFYKYVCGFGLVMALVACGGGGGNPGTPSGSSSGSTASSPASTASSPAEVAAVTPAIVEILTSTNTLPSAGSSAVITAQIKNSANVGLAGQTVTFSASSGSLQLVSAKTDSTGVVTANLTVGSDKSIRNITVTATAGSVTNSIIISVVGTSVAVSGPGSTLVGPSALTYSVKAVDSGGKPVVGAALIVSSSNGNTIAPANLSTDVNGSANFSFTPKVAGNDTLTVSGLGTSATTTVAVSNQDFAFVQPASAASLMVNTSNIVQVCYKVSGVVTAPTSAVAFSTTRGTLGVTTYPDTQGCTSTTVTSTTAGPVTISAQMGTARSSITAAFIATVPATIVLQANPSAVLPNAGSSTTNQSTLSATVRDATGNPVSGQVVNFTTTQDVSNGSIVPGSGTTDSNGMTSVQFIPGALSTPANGVVVKATVESNPTLFKTTTLTVNGNALFISIGIANTLAALDAATYQKQFSVYVTDANGAPATGRAVTISAYAPTYRKGFLTWFANATPATWGYSVVASGLASPIICPNEDVTRSGIIGGLNVDINGNGKLDPGLPVVISPATVTTDGNGFATFYLSYGKNYAWWLDTQITARATVSGTESSQIASYSLEMLTADATSQNTPPNQKSPFGTTWTGSAYDGLCNNPN